MISLIDPEALQAAVAAHSRPKSETSDHSRAGDSGDTIEHLLARCGAGLRKLITAAPEPLEDQLGHRVQRDLHADRQALHRYGNQAPVRGAPERDRRTLCDGKDFDAEIRRAREWQANNASQKSSSGVAGPVSDEPLPLFPPLPPAERYPVEALGPVLSRAALAIARKVQVPEAIAAQSVLATAALAAQAHADVVLPFGQTRPLSLFLVTIAGSGDRKSSADNEALRPIVRTSRRCEPGTIRR